MTLNKQQETEQKTTKELASLCQVNARKCYQCGKCTAGCPIAEYMDLTPNKIMHLVQLGLVEEAIKSKSIWLCATCSTCSVRCPKGLDIAHEMESLRILAKHKGIVQEKNIDKFHHVFLNSVKQNGRVYEVGLILGRNFTTGKIFRDATYGLPYLTKGKITILPDHVKNKKEIVQIFDRAEQVFKRETQKAGELV